MLAWRQAMGLAAYLALAAGCTSDDFHSYMRAEPAPMSDFLPKRERLTRQPDTFPFHYFYLTRHTNTYDRIYIAPVDVSRLKSSSVWSDIDGAIATQLGSDIDEIAKFARLAYKQAFKKSESGAHLIVTDDPKQPRTLMLEASIVGLQPTKAEVNAAGMAASLCTPVPGVGLVFSAFGAGSITVECRISDATTGRTVAMYADTESDPCALLSTTQFTWTNSARINIKEMAADTARVLAAKDYRQIERRFPVQWTSFMSDAELDEEQ